MTTCRGKCAAANVKGSEERRQRGAPSLHSTEPRAQKKRKMRRAAHSLACHAARWGAGAESGHCPTITAWARSLATSPRAASTSSAMGAAAGPTSSTTLVWPPPAGVLDGVVMPEDSPAKPGTSTTTTHRPAGHPGRPPRPMRVVDSPPAARRPFPYLASPAEVESILSAAACDDVRTVDASGRCTFTDHMVFATARSQRHAAMAAEAVAHTLSQKQQTHDHKPALTPSVEGDPGSDAWLLVDAGSVIAHIFVGADVRAEYDVEALWDGGSGGRGSLEDATKNS